MKAEVTLSRIAIKSILFATDFETLAGRALPFALALIDRYGAKLYLTHVVPPKAYAFAHPNSMECILRDEKDYASYRLNQILASVRRPGRTCEILVGEGEVAPALAAFAHARDADLLIVGTQSRGGLGKLVLDVLEIQKSILAHTAGTY